MKYSYCPFCGSENTLSMKKETCTRIKDKKVVKGIFDVWMCFKCEESFFSTWEFKTEIINEETNPRRQA